MCFQDRLDNPKIKIFHEILNQDQLKFIPITDSIFYCQSLMCVLLNLCYSYIKPNLTFKYAKIGYFLTK